jgi:hypothetical protein
MRPCDTLREHLDRERERADRAEIARDAADAGQVVEAEDGVGMALALHLTGQRERLGSVQLACWTGVGQAFGRVLNSRTRTDLEISRNDNLHPPMWISVRSPSWPERSFGSV